MKKIYADHAATTKLSSMALEAMMEFLRDDYKNPSTLYSDASISRRAIVNARNRIAECIGAKPSEIIFTSGGTESDNCAIKNIVFNKCNTRRTIITSQIEHHAILNSCKIMEELGYKVVYLPVDNYGVVSIDLLKREINDDTAIVSIMYANNEIGTIEPVKEIAQIAHSHGIIFHTDAVQAVGNIPIDVRKMNIDMLSLSGHKLYAPKGIGALYVKSGIEFERFMDGGHQEKNKRSGTENVAEIVALGKACQIAEKNIEQYQQKLKNLRDYCLNKIQKKIPDIYINGTMERRLPGNINISFKDLNSGELLLRLDEVGICASGGSACSSKEASPSHVLTAIGLPSELSKGALRLTFGDYNTKEDVEYLVENLVRIVEEMRKA